MGKLDSTHNPTQPATRLTRNPIDPTRPACFAMSRRNQTQPKMVESYIWSPFSITKITEDRTKHKWLNPLAKTQIKISLSIYI